MTDVPVIRRVVIASNISGTILAEHSEGNFLKGGDGRTIASLLRTMMNIAKGFDKGEIKVVSFGPSNQNLTGSSILASVATSNPTPQPSLNLSVCMKKEVLVGIFYTVQSEEVSTEQCSRVNAITKKIYKAFKEKHMEYYNKKDVQQKLAEAFQKSEELPKKLKERFESFSKEIKPILEAEQQQ